MKKRRVVILGHAVSDERGKSSGGKAGNQTGKELRFQEWYDRAKGWSHVLRAKKKSLRKKIAAAITCLVLNPCIGYDQKQRTTLFREASNVKWNLSKINVPCSTDCSALDAVALNACGVKVSKDIYTGDMVEKIMDTGLFYDLIGKEYTQTSENLEVGDILVGVGHTATVTEVKEMFVLERTLRYISGSLLTGDDVKELQKILKSLGYYKDKKDGIFGINTERAVISYQKARGLTPDGAVGKNTATALGFLWK